MTLLLEAQTPGLLDLSRHASRIALQTQAETITYAELADRIEHAATPLVGTRRLVLVEGANTVDSLVTYLAALMHGHVVLLSAPGTPAERLTQAWDPDAVARDGKIVLRRDGTRHDLHPDLALLLSTSGTTGAAKLVRLSRDNLISNATSIADYLRLTPDDRAVTSLPMHYCYGLSVVHSHLLVGAGLALTDLSVVDECFWQLADAAGATSFAGVPYTFDLLEQIDFDRRRPRTLRYVTQAGGRMSPERVQSWAERGRRDGYDLVVMYGQTEATARMAWLPPTLAVERPSSIGIAVPGGSLRVDPVPEAGPDMGELVYTGPNVMMGYADVDCDLGRGAELTELRTGDLAKEVDGLWEIVGRTGRQAKLFGLRLDLDHLEQLIEPVADVRCLVEGQSLHAFTMTPRSADRVTRALMDASGLPASAIRVCRLDAIPRTLTGKPDLAALARHARDLEQARTDAPSNDQPTAQALRTDFAVVLGRTDVDLGDSFTELGGDSLSYVELATRLTRRLGELPADWPTRSIADLAATAGLRRTGTVVDTTILIRALAIIAIVASHANLVTILGGAHLLLAVAGHSFARFQLSRATRRERLHHGAASLLQLVLPATVWIGAVGLLTGAYGPGTAMFLNGLVGSDEWTRQWQFWFLEALAWTTVAALALVAMPWFDRLERGRPFAVAIGLVVATLAIRFAWVGLEAGATARYTLGVVALWFALGWAAAKSTTLRQQWLVVGLAAVGTFGFFGDVSRELVIMGGIALLALVRTVRVPAFLVMPLSVIASASLFIYLTHWQVYPHLEEITPSGATAASLAVGVLVWWLARPPLRRLARALRSPAQPPVRVE